MRELSTGEIVVISGGRDDFSAYLGGSLITGAIIGAGIYTLTLCCKAQMEGLPTYVFWGAVGWTLITVLAYPIVNAK